MFDRKRPLSWTAISSFEYDPEQWYDKYVLLKAPPVSKEMHFGKLFADSCEAGKPLAPVTLYSRVEYELKATFNGVPLIGFIDTYEPHVKLGEFKTGKKAWDQKRADGHGQIDMYLLMLYIIHKVKPEEIHCQIQWIPTKEDGDFSISFVDPGKVHTFVTKRTMTDVLRFGQRINESIKAMEQYCLNHD